MPCNLKINRRPLKDATLKPKTIVTSSVNIYFIKSLHNTSRSLRVYDKILINKNTILKEMKEKSGIYRWVNKLNAKCYIGSSVSLSTRFSHYFSINYLKKRVTISNSKIYNALLTHGHNNFRLEVLEFFSEQDLIARQQYHIDRFKPDYNILKIADSTLGYKHTEATLAKFKLRKLSKSALSNLKTARKNATSSPLAKGNRLLAVYQKITIQNVITKEVNTYNSIRSAARKFGVTHTTLRDYMIKNKIFRNHYIIKKV